MATCCLRVAETADPEAQPRSTTDALQTLRDGMFAVEAACVQDRLHAMRQAQAVIVHDFVHAAREALPPLVRIPSGPRVQEADPFEAEFFGRAGGTGDGQAMLDMLTQLSPDQRTRLITHTPQDIMQAIVAARIERGDEPPWIHRGASAVSMNINTVSGQATYRMSSREVVPVTLYNRFVWGVETRAFPASMFQTGRPE